MSAADRKNNSPIKVYIRQRPLSAAEIEQKCGNIVHAIQHREIILKTGFNDKKFVCDNVFGENATQSEVYSATLAPMINNIVAGYNCTLFAYGQTGSGKTHTIFGEVKHDRSINLRKNDSVGLLARASQHLFIELSKLSARTEYTVRVSFVEMHNEEVRDLFADNVPLRVYDDPLLKGSVCMKDLRKVTVFNCRDVFDWINVGLLTRQKISAPYNLQNSRSHAIFTFLVSIREVTSRGDEIIKTGRLQLLDLAGNEYVGRERARDAGNVNRSINTLTRVTKALAQKMQHVPYRDSKLTRILQDSLSGNTKTAMIATFSPSSNSWDETVATLELGQLARSIVTNTHVNINKRQANLLKELDDEVNKIKDELAAAKRGEGVFVSSLTYEKMTGEANDSKQKILELVAKIADLENHRNSLDFQYRSLQQSFNKTKHYLETVKQMLAAKQKALQDEEMKVNAAVGRHRYMADVTNTLLDVCNSSTQNEEIYYRKYQEKSAANKQNAQASKEMFWTTSNCLQSIAHGTLTSMCATSIALDEMQHYIAVLSNQASGCILSMNQTASDVRCHAEEYKIKLNELFRNYAGNRHFRNLQNSIADVHGRNLTNLKSHIRTRNTVEALRKRCDEYIYKMETQTEEALENVVKATDESKLLMKSGKKNVSVIITQLRSRREAIRAQRRLNEAAAEASRREIARAEQENQNILNRAAAVEAAMAAVKSTKDDIGNFVVQQMQEFLTNYFQNPSKIVNTTVSKIDETVQQVDSSEIVMCNQAVSGRSAIDQQVTGMAATVDENLVQGNEELGDRFHTWQASLYKNARENLVQNLMLSSEKTEDALKRLLQEQMQRNVSVTTHVGDVVKNLQQCGTSIHSFGHVGDTPAKRTYNYPRKISFNPNPQWQSK